MTPVWITREDVDDLVERWHDGEGIGLALHEYLGMTMEEYKAFFERHVLPDPRVVHARQHPGKVCPKCPSVALSVASLEGPPAWWRLQILGEAVLYALLVLLVGIILAVIR